MHIKFNDKEKKIIKECLNATVNGPFFPDWEFHTLLGFERLYVKDIFENWSEMSELKESANDIILVIKVSIGNLLSYPHGNEDVWSDYISISKQELEAFYESFVISIKN